MSVQTGVQPVDEIIRDLSKLHRTPKQVEQYGVEVVPEKQRTVRWIDFFAILMAFMLNPVMYLLTGLGVIAFKLPYWYAIWANVLGIGLAFIGFSAIATLGVDYGIPGQAGIRSIMGIRGARFITSPLRVIASIYWFAAQTLGSSLALVAIIKAFSGFQVNFLLTALFFAIIQSILAVIGFDAMKYFVRVVLPFMLGLTLLILYLFLSQTKAEFLFANVIASSNLKFTWAGFAGAAGLMLGTWTTMITDSADFCRYARSRQDMWYGFFFGAIIGTFLAGIIACYAAVAAGDWNPFTVASQLTPNKFVLVLLFVGVIVNTISINILNHYSGGFSLVNTLPKLGRFWCTVIVAILSIIMSLFPTFIQNAQNWITMLGNVFIPLAAVLLTDYLLIKKTHMDVMALFDIKGRYRYFAGFNPVAILCVIIGLIVFKTIPQNYWPALLTYVITGIIYYILIKIAAALFPSISYASQPAEAELDSETITRTLIDKQKEEKIGL